MKYRLAAVSLFALVASTLLVCLLAAEPASPLAPIAPLAQAFTSPSSVKAVPPPCAVFMPSSGFPGDCVVITFTHNLPIVPISNATVLLLDARGKTVARSEAFTTATDITSALLTEGTTLAGSTQAYAKEGHTGFPDILPRKPVLVAILALPHDLSSGQYRIQTHYLAGATIIADEKPFTLEARTFPSEEITFNGKNTAIKKNMSFKRLTEIKKLNDLLIYQGQNAPRFPGPFVLPVRTQRITSFFAQSRTLRYSTGQSEEAVHYGIDFGIPTGSQVSAGGRRSRRDDGKPHINWVDNRYRT